MNSPFKKTKPNVTPFVFLKCDTAHHSSTLRSDPTESQQRIWNSISTSAAVVFVVFSFVLFFFLRNLVGFRLSSGKPCTPYDTTSILPMSMRTLNMS